MTKEDAGHSLQSSHWHATVAAQLAKGGPQCTRTFPCHSCKDQTPTAPTRTGSMSTIGQDWAGTPLATAAVHGCS
jgi:hypothetical protein